MIDSDFNSRGSSYDNSDSSNSNSDTESEYDAEPVEKLDSKSFSSKQSSLVCQSDFASSVSSVSV